MKMFLDVPKVYLHKQSVDFRKSINGLSLLVEQEMQLSPFSGALFVFCNRQRTRLKVLYWDSTGFCLWYKRLEKTRFAGQGRCPEKYCLLASSNGIGCCKVSIFKKSPRTSHCITRVWVDMPIGYKSCRSHPKQSKSYQALSQIGRYNSGHEKDTRHPT
ncbi:IS66 family insertion sequence element accessory protein TnpB [Rheinheimera sp. UJ63]|uniref:IS66 family insertion sequence element accessory protein TnpB n=1 Tax=Rheinheimera sp. UJ63 TaxID=2910157 RepID=UPI001F388D9B|nr:IS66 family insertion sequence element accessory protein TnpB [Rheinheimera sp. UJ63]MCF4010576.1 IS66 family insertion sequence element accessory protein TnpB [Rheinheimera sp. UJ63]